MALVAHLWMFASHTDEPMASHADAATTGASVTDAPLPTTACNSGMSACTAAPVEEPRLPSMVVLSPLAVVLLAVHDRGLGVRSRPRSSGAEPAPPLTPVTAGVLLLE